MRALNHRHSVYETNYRICSRTTIKIYVYIQMQTNSSIHKHARAYVARSLKILNYLPRNKTFLYINSRILLTQFADSLPSR